MKTREQYERDFETRVEARIAFAHRRKELISNWFEAADKTGPWALSTAKSLQLCNDAELELMGGTN